MTVKEILIHWLKANGYEGLCEKEYECGCTIEDFMPCCMPSDNLLLSCEPSQSCEAVQQHRDENGAKMTIREILIEWLKENANNYDGLCRPSTECGCGVEDFMPCCEPSPNCEAGHRRKAPEDSDADDDGCLMYPGKGSVPFKKSEVSLRFGWYDVGRRKTVVKKAKVQGFIYKGLVVHRRQVMIDEGVFVENNGWIVSHIHSGLSIMGEREPLKTSKKAKEYCVLMAESADWTQSKTFIGRHMRIYWSKEIKKQVRALLS